MDCRQGISGAWAAFNEWRVKGWPFRVVVLLLLFAWPLYESVSGDFLIVRLVRIACDAILMGSEPKAVNAKYHYYCARDAQHLRYIIESHFDMNHDGVLESQEFALLSLEGLNPAELYKKTLFSNASFAEISYLANFAKRYNIIPKNYSIKELRREAFSSALAENERETAVDRAEINRMISSAVERKAYQNWRFWKDGLLSVFGQFSWIFAPFHLTIAWLLLCYFVAAGLASGLGDKRIAVLGAMAALGALLLVQQYFLPRFIEWLWGASGRDAMSTIFSGDKWHLTFAGGILLGLAAALKGARSGLQLSWRKLSVAILSLGLFWICAEMLVSLVGKVWPGFANFFSFPGVVDSALFGVKGEMIPSGVGGAYFSCSNFSFWLIPIAALLTAIIVFLLLLGRLKKS